MPTAYSLYEIYYVFLPVDNKKYTMYGLVLEVWAEREEEGESLVRASNSTQCSKHVSGPCAVRLRMPQTSHVRGLGRAVSLFRFPMNCYVSTPFNLLGFGWDIK